MPTLILSYKGYELRLVFAKSSYYLRQEFEPGKQESEPGKTMYQILFEHLIDGKLVSAEGFARAYKKVNLFISSFSIRRLMKVVETALKKSKDKRLRKMHFNKLPAYGIGLSPEQREIIKRTMQELHSGGKRLSNEVLRAACLEALRQRNLAGNLLLEKTALRRLKRQFGFPIPPQPPQFKRARMR